MVAKRIVVFGEVQGVGYRNKVRQSAIANSIRGFVENQTDGSVLIVAVADSDKLEKFIREINIRKWPVDVNKIGVSKISIEENFGNFAIRRGRVEEEMIEKGDEVIVHLEHLASKINGLEDKTETGLTSLGKKTELGFTSLGKKTELGFTSLGKKTETGLINLSKKLDKLDTIDNTIKTEFKKLNKLDKLDAIDSTLKSEFKKLDKLNKLNTIDHTIKSEFGKLDKKYDKFSDALSITNRLLARIAEKI